MHFNILGVNGGGIYEITSLKMAQVWGIFKDILEKVACKWGPKEWVRFLPKWFKRQRPVYTEIIATVQRPKCTLRLGGWRGIRLLREDGGWNPQTLGWP